MSREVEEDHLPRTPDPVISVIRGEMMCMVGIALPELRSLVARLSGKGGNKARHAGCSIAMWNDGRG